MINNQNSEVYSKFYIHVIIFLNKLEIVENTNKRLEKNKIRIWCTSEIHRFLLDSLGPGPMYWMTPLPLIGPDHNW
jgi:hypothetical protein